MKQLDELDKALERGAYETPGACIIEIIRPFLTEKSESVLRQRIRDLELRHLIRLEHTKREVLVYPVDEVENFSHSREVIR
jgi:predicted transcriptional regulator